jgi:hypothetical protein
MEDDKSLRYYKKDGVFLMRTIVDEKERECVCVRQRETEEGGS